jgi:uncharacterized membrane protein YkvA (DUF1232 family)
MKNDFVSNGIGSVRRQDGQRVIDQEATVARKLGKLNPAKYKGFIGNIRALFSMLKDYWRGEYTDVPWFVIAAVIFALLYFINPADLIPDVIPIAGYVDDATVVGIVIASIRSHLDNYKDWKKSA